MRRALWIAAGGAGLLIFFALRKARASEEPKTLEETEKPVEDLGLGPNGGKLIRLPDGRVVEVPTTVTVPNLGSSEEPPVETPPPPPPPRKKWEPRTSEEREVVTKATSLVKSKFGGDWRAAFDHYAGSDGRMSSKELVKLLDDAGIGFSWFRGEWASQIIKAIDKSGDGTISWEEFEPIAPNY